MADDAQEVLDEMIEFWRESDEDYAEYYVDALQSARKNIVGDTLEE